MCRLLVYNPEMSRGLLPRLGDVFFLAIFAGCLLLGQRILNTDGDVGRHLAMGSYILESRSIPTRDIFSFTLAGQTRPPYEWLAQVAFATAHRLLGLDGVILLIASVMATTFLLLYLDARRRSGAPLIALGFATWAAAASSLHWLARPHVLTFLFLVCWLALLEQVRLGHARLAWWLPPLMVLWANMHGGFVFGILAWAAYATGCLADRQRSGQATAGRGLLFAGLGSIAASLLTPGSWHSWSAILRNSSRYILARTAETLPPSIAAPGTWPFFVLAAAAVILWIRMRSSVAPAHVLLLLGFGLMAAFMARNVPLFCIAAVPVLATWAGSLRQGDGWLEQSEDRVVKLEDGMRGFVWPPLLVLVGLLGFGIAVRRGLTSQYSFEPARYPVRAVQWLNDHAVQGEMFNDLNWGGYLLYRLWPERRVFIDSQTDFYGEVFVRNYAHILAGGPGWETALDKDHVGWVIVPRWSALVERIRLASGWQILYQDSTTTIAARAGS